MIESFALARPMVLFALLLVPLYAVWRWRSLRRAGVSYAPLQFQAAGRTGGARFIAGAEALDPFDFPDEGETPQDSGMAAMGPSRLELSKPVIAAVSGPAVAGGMELAL